MPDHDERPPGLMDILGELGMEGATYAGLQRDLITLDPTLPAVRFENARVTYGELVGRVGATASYLRELGADRGDRIAIMAGSSIDNLVVHLAVQAVGAVGVLVNTSLFGATLQQVLSAARAGVALADQRQVESIRAVQPQLPELTTVVSFEDPGCRRALNGCEDLLPFLDALETTPLDPAFINYTSGTTGLPKGVVLKQVFSAGALVVARRLGLQERTERIYIPTPMYHAMGVAMTAMGLRLAAELVIAPRFSATRYWDDVRTHQCTFAYHVGTIAQMLFNQPPSASDGQHDLKVFFGGGMPAPIWEDFSSRFNVRIVEAYSASDGLGSIVNWGDGPVGSFGRCDPELEVRVVDTADLAVPVGEPGELQIRPAGGGVPEIQYDNDRAASEDKTRGGWVRTGDLVRQDAKGNLYFVDRIKDVIRHRGVNIAPAEIERIVVGHPHVRECAALAVPSDLGEDDIKLVFVADTRVDPEELGRFFDDVLPTHMRPRYLEQVDALPKTITERVQRYKLKDSWRTAATWDLREKSLLAAALPQS